MDITQMREQMKVQEWLDEQEEFLKSKMTVNQWCKLKHISRNAFYYRQRKIHRAAVDVLNADHIATKDIVFAQVPNEVYKQNEIVEVATATPAPIQENNVILDFSAGKTKFEIYSCISDTQLKTVLEFMSHAK